MRSTRASTPILNAAAYFVDRHIDEGRAESIAIECGDRRLTYRDLHEQVNRTGNALRHELGVRPEERIVLLMPTREKAKGLPSPLTRTSFSAPAGVLRPFTAGTAAAEPPRSRRGRA